MTTEPRTPDPVVALGEAILVSAWGYNFEPPDAARIGVDLAPKVLAALTEAGWSLTRNDGLDAAWAAAEAALPEGWSLLIGDTRATQKQGGWWATASEPYDEVRGGFKVISSSHDSTLYDTPALALAALTERLKEVGDG